MRADGEARPPPGAPCPAGSTQGDLCPLSGGCRFDRGAPPHGGGARIGLVQCSRSCTKPAVFVPVTVPDAVAVDCKKEHDCKKADLARCREPFKEKEALRALLLCGIPPALGLCVSAQPAGASALSEARAPPAPAERVGAAPPAGGGRVPREGRAGSLVFASPFASLDDGVCGRGSGSGTAFCTTSGTSSTWRRSARTTRRSARAPASTSPPRRRTTSRTEEMPQPSFAAIDHNTTSFPAPALHCCLSEEKETRRKWGGCD